MIREKHKTVKEHPHAMVLREIANGVPISEFEVRLNEWAENHWENPEKYTFWLSGDGWELRRKRRMHKLGEHTFPAPLTEVPEVYTVIYMASVDGYFSMNGIRGDEYDKELIGSGCAHGSASAAKAHSIALAAIARGEPV